jgi:hypothetical protein
MLSHWQLLSYLENAEVLQNNGPFLSFWEHSLEIYCILPTATKEKTSHKDGLDGLE